MGTIDLIKKIFIGGEWSVGYRKIGSKEYTLVPVDNGWIADPFLFEYKGEHYLFVEYMNEKKGEIAYYRFINGEPVFQKIIISKPYHLSYPCVFTHGSDVYMIPESADNHSIELYKASCFPDEWKKIKQLASGVYYDTTFIDINEECYLISYRKEKGLFLLDMFSFEFSNYTINKIGEKEYTKNIGRPAGRFCFENGVLLRPAQDCERKYGERILFYQVDLSKTGILEEKIERSLDVSKISEQYQRVHTYNRDSLYEVVDLFKEQLHPFRLLSLLYKKVIQRIGNRR